MEQQQKPLPTSRGLHNWKNLFAIGKDDIWWGLFFLMLFLTIYAYKADLNTCKDAATHPCSYCLITNETLRNEVIGENPTEQCRVECAGLNPYQAKQINISNEFTIKG